MVMFEFIVGALLAVVAVVSWVLLRTYQYMPQRELKRHARSGDEVAQLLYRAVAYGVNLRILLGSIAVVSGVLSLMSLASAMGLLVAILVLAAVVVLGWVALVPGDEVTHASIWLAKRAAPSIAWLLERLHPIITIVARLTSRLRRVQVHTGLYERADLIELLERQKGQGDSRISNDEIELLQHALTFGDKFVSDALVPIRVVKLVATTDAIGPVLMDELSKSGHSRFPVYDGKRDHVVGVLYLHDLVSAKHSGTVIDVMSSRLTYVHEDFTLYQALQAFLKTKRHLFLVVNSFEELVGILTIEDVLEQIIGKPIVDEFDRYDDLRAVAAAAAQKEHNTHLKAKTEPEAGVQEPEATPESKEVVK